MCAPPAVCMKHSVSSPKMTTPFVQQQLEASRQQDNFCDTAYHKLPRDGAHNFCSNRSESQIDQYFDAMSEGSNSVGSVVASSDCGSSISGVSDRARSGVSDSCFNLYDAIRCSDWKGKLIEEKRRRRAAEQSLTELAHRLSRLRTATNSLSHRSVADKDPSPAGAVQSQGTQSTVASGSRGGACCHCFGLASCAGQDVDAPSASAFSLDSNQVTSKAFGWVRGTCEEAASLHSELCGDNGVSDGSSHPTAICSPVQTTSRHPPGSVSGRQSSCHSPRCAAALEALSHSAACQLAAAVSATETIEREAASKVIVDQCHTSFAGQHAELKASLASTGLSHAGLMAGCAVLGAICTLLILGRTR